MEEDQFGDNEGELTYELQTTPLLDISDDVINEGERGLLGLAFSSDGRKLYLDYTRQPDGHTVVVEYTLGDSTRIDDDSRREILFVEQPYANHNGGQLAIGPDGYLYIGLGDGGGGGDPLGHGQDTSTLLGSILRIDPERAHRGRTRLRHPAGQPLRRRRGRGRPRSGCYGARNPWRFSFDTATGDLWVADVGPGRATRRSTGSRPTAASTPAGAPTSAGRDGGHPPLRGGENPDGRRAADLRVRPRRRAARSSAATCTGGRRSPRSRAPTSTPTTAAPGFAGLQVDGDTVIDTRTWDLPLDGGYSLGQDDAGELYVLLGGGRVVKLVTAGDET